MMIEIKCTINVMCLNHSETTTTSLSLSLEKLSLQNWFLVPKRLETADLGL